MQYAGNKPSGRPASQQWSCDATGKFLEQRVGTSLLWYWAEAGKEWNRQSKVPRLALNVQAPQAMVLPGIFRCKKKTVVFWHDHLIKKFLHSIYLYGPSVYSRAVELHGDGWLHEMKIILQKKVFKFKGNSFIILVAWQVCHWNLKSAVPDWYLNVISSSTAPSCPSA